MTSVYSQYLKNSRKKLLSQEWVKLRTSNFVRIDRNKSPLNISGKVAVGVLRNSRKCSDTHI